MKNNDIFLLEKIYISIYENNTNKNYAKGSGAVFGPETISLNKDFTENCEVRAKPIVRWLLSKNFLTTNSCGGHKPGDPIIVDIVPNIEIWKYELYSAFGGGYSEDDPMHPLNWPEREWPRWRKKIKNMTHKSNYIKLKNELEKIIPKINGVSVDYREDPRRAPEKIIHLSIAEDAYNDFIKQIGIIDSPLKNKMNITYNSQDRTYTYT